MSKTYERSTTQARKRWALAIAARADAKSDRAERRACRREGAGRRAYVEALRLADLAEA